MNSWGRQSGWLLVLFLLSLPVAHAQETPSCDEAIAGARAEYFEGRFDQALLFLNHCLSQGAFQGDEKEEAYTLLGKVYFAKGLEDRATDALRELLTLVPSYRPDPTVEPPNFVAFVDEVRQKMAQAAPPPDEIPSEDPPQDPQAEAEPPIVQPPPEDLPPTAERTPPEKKSGITKWLLIGGGVVAAGLAAVLLTGGDPPPPSGTPLPTPPAFPR